MKQIKAQFTELRLIKLNLLYSWIMIQLHLMQGLIIQVPGN